MKCHVSIKLVNCRATECNDTLLGLRPLGPKPKRTFRIFMKVNSEKYSQLQLGITQHLSLS